VRGRESDIYGDKMLIPDVDRALETPSLSANTTMNSLPPAAAAACDDADAGASFSHGCREMLFVFPRGGGCIMHERVSNSATNANSHTPLADLWAAHFCMLNYCCS